MIRRDEAARLRRIAETRLAASDVASARKLADLSRLVHELQVHQIELELQNEALQNTREELRQSRDRYAQLYEWAPVGYLSLSHDGHTVRVNQAAARLFGIQPEDLLQHPFADRVAPDDRKRWNRHLHNSLRHPVRHSIEIQLMRGDGSSFDARVDSAASPGEGEKPSLLVTVIDLTERRELEAARQEAPSWVRLKNIARRLPGVIYEYRLRPDGSSCFPFASEAMLDIYRVNPEEVREDASSVFERIHPDDRDRVMASIRLSARKLSPWREEYRVSFEDGSPRWLLGNAIPRRDVDGSTLWYGFIADITESRIAEDRLQLAAKVFAHTREAIMITTADGTIVEVNDAFTLITGYRRDEVLGRNPRILSSGRHGEAFFAGMWRALGEKGYWYSEIWNRRKGGALFAALLTVSAIYDAGGKTEHFVALFADITTIKEHESQLEHIAHFDALTTLPNRVLFADRLHQAMVQAHRRGQKLVVAYIDLDGFKLVNDRHGHEAGDQLLMAVAMRIKQVLREGDTLARLGGDEFAAVLIDLADVGASIPTLVRMLGAAAQPVSLGELTLQVSASIGVTVFPQLEEVDADQLLRQADQAMYQAKLAGKNRYHVFDAERDRSERGHHESLAHIRKAMGAGELMLHYQPKVNMRTGAVVGVEALVRWQHPERGLLPPSVFLPVIEDDPLAVALGEWVIDSVLIQMARWRANGLKLPVSVNIGARQLQQTDFLWRLRRLLAAHPDVSPADLELEVLETSALEDLMRVSAVIESCLDIGVAFSLDDFGTGYSSLTYLKHLHVSQLKIDQSFVHDMLDDPDDLTIVESVLGLARAFRREVIAEGVETVAQGELLVQLGCELAQGYVIAKPMPADELPAWVAGWRPDPVWCNQPVTDDRDHDLIYAAVELRAWVSAIEAYLEGKRSSPPSLEHRVCRLGEWLANLMQTGKGDSEAVRAIDALHRRIHALGNRIFEVCEQGRRHEVGDQLDELRRLRDDLLWRLRAGRPND